MLDFRHRVLVCQDHFQVFEEMETSSEPREEAGGFLAEPRQGLGLVPFKLKFIYPVICIGNMLTHTHIYIITSYTYAYI